MNELWVSVMEITMLGGKELSIDYSLKKYINLCYWVCKAKMGLFRTISIKEILLFIYNAVYNLIVAIILR